MGLIKSALKSVDALAEKVPEVIDLGLKIGSDAYEQQKALIKIPDLKDVYIEEATRVLNELHLLPTFAIAKPNIAYADESENKVTSSEPKFGSRVSPGTAVKVYYLTQEVIEKSKDLLGSALSEFSIPMVIGLNRYEAREDLESLGLRVSEKIETPNLSFANKEDGQVTRVTYPNNQKIGPKLKNGERVWLYYVTDEVILESKSIQIKKEEEKQEAKEKFEKATKDFAKDLSAATIDTTKNLAQNMDKIGKVTKDISKETMDTTKDLAQKLGKQLGKLNIKLHKKEEK